MKASQTMIESLSDMDGVRSLGDVRRILGAKLLALARKEISATDVVAAAKIVDAMAHTIDSEVKVARTAIELRDRGGNLGRVAHLGTLEIGTPDKEPQIDNPFPAPGTAR